MRLLLRGFDVEVAGSVGDVRDLWICRLVGGANPRWNERKNGR